MFLLGVPKIVTAISLGISFVCPRLCYLLFLCHGDRCVLISLFVRFVLQVERLILLQGGWFFLAATNGWETLPENKCHRTRCFSEYAFPWAFFAPTLTNPLFFQTAQFGRGWKTRPLRKRGWWNPERLAILQRFFHLKIPPCKRGGFPCRRFWWSGDSTPQQLGETEGQFLLRVRMLWKLLIC